MNRAFKIAIAAIITGSFSAAPALACPDGEYEGLFGWCYPNSGKVIGTVTRPITETLAVSGGEALAQWISASRNSAQGGNPSPIPWHIRYQLQNEFPANVLDRVRYKIGDNGFFNAARNIMFNGDVSAVTLDHIVVFRSAGDAESNVPLWAHELRHVQQYADWGVRDFAIRYTRNFNAVEDEAYAKERQVANRGLLPPPAPQNVPYSTSASGPMSMPPMNVSIPVRFCQTPIGTCAIQPTYIPMGSPCWCNDMHGRQWNGSAF